MSASSIWRLPPDPAEEPLWRRTQLRLQNMATFTAQLTPMSHGLEPVYQAMEQTVDAQAHLLVQLIKRWEERQEESPPG